jgi:hypothetical protein
LPWFPLAPVPTCACPAYAGCIRCAQCFCLLGEDCRVLPHGSAKCVRLRRCAERARVIRRIRVHHATLVVQARLSLQCGCLWHVVLAVTVRCTVRCAICDRHILATRQRILSLELLCCILLRDGLPYVRISLTAFTMQYCSVDHSALCGPPGAAFNFVSPEPSCESLQQRQRLQV